MMRLTPTVKHLLILNVLVFIGINYFLSNELRFIFYQNLSIYFPLNEFFEFWQIGTHMFMHGDFKHLLFNMFALWMFGNVVEQMFGQRKFLFFYLSCGIGAIFLHVFVQFFNFSEINNLFLNISHEDVVRRLNNIIRGDYIYEFCNTKFIRWFENNNEIFRNLHSCNAEYILEEDYPNIIKLYEKVNFSTPLLGASGAIMGILVAFGMLNPNAELMLIFLPIPIKAKYFIPGIIALDLFSAVSGVSIFSPSNTAYIAHIGGALTGFLMMYFWKKNQFDKYRWN